MALFAVLAALLAGCGKKNQPAPKAEGGPAGGTVERTPADDAADRTKLLTKLKTARGDAQRDAADTLADWAIDDPEIVPALVELLKDKTTAGSGKTHPTQVGSTREAAVMALLRCGPKGEAALKDKGVAILAEGLKDPSPAVREHTAFTLGILGPRAKPTAAGVQALCTDPDKNVRGVAFDALRSIGVADVPGFAALLTHAEPDARRLAAEMVPALPEVPAAAVPPLVKALADEDETVRVGAAEGLATAGPAAGKDAAKALADAITKAYPPEFDPMRDRLDGPELAYWKALGKIGEPAVPAASGLFGHTNPIVRALAARTLGEIGPPARPAADALKKALTDRFADVALEAACALCLIGEGQAEAVELVKRALDADGPLVASAAIAVVPRMGPAGKPLVPQVLAKLGSDNPNTRYAAAEFVGMLEPPEAEKAVPGLAKLAADEFPEVRRRVGAVLEKLGPAAAPAAEAVGKALAAETDTTARDQFIDALAAIGPGAKPAVPALLALLADKNLHTDGRVKVVHAVAVSDPGSAEVSAALVKAAGDSDPQVRSAVAGAMGKLNPLPADALASLVKLAKTDREVRVRAAALRAMAEAGPRAKPARVELEAIAGGTLPNLALWAKVAVAAVDGDIRKSAGVVRAGLTDKNGAVRGAAAEALPLVGPSAEDVPALLRLMKDPSAKVAAARAVGAIGAGAKEAVPGLTQLLGDRDADARAAAAEALGRIGPAALPAVGKLKDLATDPTAGPAARKALDKLGVKVERPKR